MAWSTHPVIVTGQTFTATDWNTYVKGNLDTLWSYTTGMQVAYSTSSTTLSKATANNGIKFLKSDTTNTGIDFLSMVHSYQSRTSTGTTNSFTKNISFQCGYYQFGSTDSTASVTFPSAFTATPLLFLLQDKFFQPSYINLTNTGFTLGGAHFERVTWIAIGEI